MQAFVVFQPYALDVDVAQDVLLAYAGEIGVHGQRSPGQAAGVKVQRLQVCVAQVEVELVEGVVGLA